VQKGIVMKIARRHYVVLTPEGTFLRVPKRIDAEIGQEIQFEEEKKPLLSFIALPGKTAILGGVAAVLVLMAVLLPIMWGPTDAHAETYVYIDLNSSLELGIDKNSQVVELRALDPAAEKLVQGLDWEGVPINQMVVMVLNRAQEKGYLKPHERIVVSQVVKGENKSEISQKTLDQIKATIGGDPELNQSQVDFFTLPLPDILKAEAEKAGLSPAKYAVWILAMRNDLEITIEEMVELSMSDAMDLVDLAPVLRNPPSEQEWEEWVKEILEGEKETSDPDSGDKGEPDQSKKSDEEDKQEDDGEKDGEHRSTNGSSGDSSNEEPVNETPSPSQPVDEGEPEPKDPEPDEPPVDGPDSEGSMGSSTLSNKEE
jgi:hypothetical protein